MRLALFVTCLTDNFFPRVGLAVARTLEHLGCEVVFPEAQTCCGQPGYNSGCHREAADLVVQLADLFDEFEYVVTPSGSCAAMVKLHAIHLFERGSDRCRKVEALAAKTHEFSSFVTSILGVDWADLGVRLTDKFTFHYPCHLRGLTSPLQAEAEAARLGGGFVPLERADSCCGFGGTFATSYPEISARMLEDKVACIVASGATTLICNEGGCGLNIGGGLHRQRRDVRMRHIAELVAEAQGWQLPPEANA